MSTCKHQIQNKNETIMLITIVFVSLYLSHTVVVSIACVVSPVCFVNVCDRLIPLCSCFYLLIHLHEFSLAVAKRRGKTVHKKIAANLKSTQLIISEVLSILSRVLQGTWHTRMLSSYLHTSKMTKYLLSKSKDQVAKVISWVLPDVYSVSVCCWVSSCWWES